MSNPIIQHELIGLLRSRFAFLSLVAVSLALGLLLILRWPSDGSVDITGSEARQVFHVFLYGLTIALMFIVPVFPATSIVRERRQNTLALLLNSPLSGVQIVVGKLVGTMGLVVLLLVLSLPAASACYAMGGIDLGRQLLPAYCLLLCLTFQYASLGLLVSSYARTIHGAARLTYGLILLLSLLTMGPYQFLHGGASVNNPVLIHGADWLRCLSPIPAVMEIAGHEGVVGAGLGEGKSITLRYCVLAVGCGVAMLVWLAYRMNLSMLDESRHAGKVTDERTAVAQGFRRVVFLWFFDPQRRSGLIGGTLWKVLPALVITILFVGAALWWSDAYLLTEGIGIGLMKLSVGVALWFIAGLSAACVVWMVASINPVTVKEQKSARFGRGHWMIRLFGGCLVISLVLMLATTSSTVNWGVETLGAIIVVLQGSLVVLVTPSLAGGIISSECEDGGWDLLRMTPLSPTGIIVGKLICVAYIVFLMLLATLPAYVVILYIKPAMLPIVMRVLLTVALMTAFAVLLSAAMSSLFRKTALATAVAYTLLLVLLVGTLFVWLGEGAPFSRQTVETVLQFNAIAASLQLIEARGFENYNLVPAAWWFMLTCCGVFAVVLVVRTAQLRRPS